jgi:hypothetical protein
MIAMKRRVRKPIHHQFPWLGAPADPCRARLVRYDDPASAEDDYYRFANRSR